MSESAEVLKIRCINALEKYWIKKDLESAAKKLESTKKDFESLQNKYNILLKKNQTLQDTIVKSSMSTTTVTEESEKDEESGLNTMEKLIETSNTLTPVPNPEISVFSSDLTEGPKLKPQPKPKTEPVQKHHSSIQNGCTSCGAPITGYNTTSYWDCSLGRHVTKPSRICSNCDRSSLKLF